MKLKNRVQIIKKEIPWEGVGGGNGYFTFWENIIGEHNSHCWKNTLGGGVLPYMG